MKFRAMWLPLVAALALPGALRAQEDECPCRQRPGMIGVQFDTNGSRGEGVRVIEVRPGSPAAQAGVRAGDVVVRVNGDDAAETVATLPMRLQSGDTVHLRVRREGGEREVVIVAAPRPGAMMGMAGPGGEFRLMRPEMEGERIVIINGDTVEMPGGMHPGGRLGMLPGMDGERIIIVNGDSMHIPLEALTFRIDSLRTQLMEMEGGRFEVRMDSVVRVFGDSAAMWQERMPNVRFHMREGMPEDVMVEGMAFGEGRPFFMELGRRAAAGAELAEMNEGLSTYFGGQREGALVIDVAPETPAARAGLRPGDVIVRAGGQEVANPEDVRRALNRAEEGQVAVEVIRQGRRQTLSLEWAGADRMFQREIRGRAVPRN